jgi:HD-like signal output (HDOD) protein
MARKILIIEKHEKVRAAMSEVLTAAGYETAGVEHGVAAALRMRQEVPELILIDQDVDLGGLRTARILRLHPAYQQIPILLLVDPRKAEPLAEEGRKLNLGAFVPKPCTGAELGKRIEDGLRQKLEKIAVAEVRAELAKLSNLPVLKPAYRRVTNLLGQEDGKVDIPELIRTMEQDQGLTTLILRVCHSAYYGFRGNSIEGATTFLGIDKLRKVIQAVLVFDVFAAERIADEREGFSLLGLWKHAVACGVIMEEGGHRVRGRDHFIAGMLHDVGKVLLYLRFPEHFTEILRLVEAEPKSFYQVERELLGMAHTDLGQELARRWDLPSTITVGIAFHHQPSAALQHRRLACLVHLSDILARTLEVGQAGDRQKIRMDPGAQPLAKYVFAAAQDRERIMAQVESIVGEGARQA